MREPFPRRRIRHSVDILSVKSSDFAIVASVIHGSRAPSVGQLVSRSQINQQQEYMQRVDDESACDEPFETYVGWFREGILQLTKHHGKTATAACAHHEAHEVGTRLMGTGA